jgi:molecular chaperone HscB
LPPFKLDPFIRFGITHQFDIDVSEVERHYVKLQQQLHPDRFAQASDQEKRFATAHTLEINEAYQQLISPLQRAQYLLQREGFDVGHDSRTAVKASKELLMESLEAREFL